MESAQRKKPATHDIATMTVKRCKPKYLKLSNDTDDVTNMSKNQGVQTLVSAISENKSDQKAISENGRSQGLKAVGTEKSKKRSVNSDSQEVETDRKEQSIKTLENIENYKQEAQSVGSKSVTDNGDNKGMKSVSTHKSSQLQEEKIDAGSDEIISTSSFYTVDDPILSFHDGSYIDYQSTLTDQVVDEENEIEKAEEVSTDKSVQTNKNSGSDNQVAETMSNDKSSKLSVNDDNDKPGAETVSSDKSIKRSVNGDSDYQGTEKVSSDKSIKRSVNGDNDKPGAETVSSDKSIKRSVNGDSDYQGTEKVSSDKSIKRSVNDYSDYQGTEKVSSDKSIEHSVNGDNDKPGAQTVSSDKSIKRSVNSDSDYQGTEKVSSDKSIEHSVNGDNDKPGAETVSSDKSIKHSVNGDSDFQGTEKVSSDKSIKRSVNDYSDYQGTEKVSSDKSIKHSVNGDNDKPGAETVGSYKSIKHSVNSDSDFQGTEKVSNHTSTNSSVNSDIDNPESETVSNDKSTYSKSGENQRSPKKSGKTSIDRPSTENGKNQIAGTDNQAFIKKQREKLFTKTEIIEQDQTSVTSDDSQLEVNNSPWGEPHRKIRIPPYFFDRKIQSSRVYENIELEDDFVAGKPLKYLCRPICSKPMCYQTVNHCPCCEQQPPSTICNCLKQTCSPVINCNAICQCFPTPCPPQGPLVYDVGPAFPIYLVNSSEPASTRRTPYGVNVIDFPSADFVTISQQKPAGVPSNYKWSQRENRDMNNGSLDKPTGRHPPTIICYICGREYGTASIGIHEKQCLEKWRRVNSQLPKNMQRPEPVKPQQYPVSSSDTIRIQIPGSGKSSYDLDSINKEAFESVQSQYIKCEKCGRTFLPDRLKIHIKNCRGYHKIASGR